MEGEFASATEALAYVWASIDGKSQRFLIGRAHDGLERLGCYMGYMIEAKEMIKRLEAHGFTISPTPSSDAGGGEG